MITAVEAGGIVALTHEPSNAMAECELTYVRRSSIDLDRAREQHASYRRTLTECGANVRVLNANTAMPDCHFIEDTAVVFDEVAILASPGAESRRGEPASIAPVLREYREVLPIVLPATLDGGDVTVTGRDVLVGRSSRTNTAGFEAMRELLRPFGYRVRQVRVKHCLHLKSATTSLPDGRLLANPDWLETADLAGLEWVAIPPEEEFAADVALVGETVVAADAFPRTIAMLDELGFAVKSVDLSEFAKAEGGVTCLSLIFRAS